MAEEHVDGQEALGKLLVREGGLELRQLLAQVLRQVMEAEVTALCGAAPGERSVARVNQRNGYRARPFETRLGSLELAVPKLRTGSYFPSFLEPRRRWEKAFVCVVCEAYVKGVSTRKVEALVEAMDAKGMSKSEVSRMAQGLDEQVTAWRTRPLDRDYPYVWLDALYLKIREGGRVVSRAVLVAYAVTDQGNREVLGVDIAAGEMEDCWRSFLADLVSRGLSGVKLVISDAHLGLRAGIRAVLNGTTWQRCTVHFLRNVLSHVPRKAQSMVSAAVRNIFNQPSRELARAAADKAIELLEKHCPRAAELLREAEEDVLAFMSFPEDHWRKIRSTNPLERLNKEIRRRTNVVGIFPNASAALRLVGMLLVEQNDEWLVGRRYLSLRSMALVTGAPTVPPRAMEPG